MDSQTKLALGVISKAQDDLLVKVAALTAIVGALSEAHAPDLKRVDAWCRKIAAASHKELGVSQTAIQRLAHDLLRGI